MAKDQIIALERYLALAWEKPTIELGFYLLWTAES